MARTVNEEEYNAKRTQILDVAQHLIYTRGYERMAIQDLLDALHISKGAFYHYFVSKPAVLEALIERIQQDGERPLLLIVNDTNLSALEKLQRFFATLEGSISVHNTFIADLLRVWLSDENAIVREKVYKAMSERRKPLLTVIVRQGIEERVFTTRYPEHTSDAILSLARGLGDTLAGLMLAIDQASNEQHMLNEIVATYAAYADALERTLGAESSFLQRPDTQAIKSLITTIKNGSLRKE